MPSLGELLGLARRFIRDPVPVTLWIGFFFFNDTATTEIYTLSLHDALPICNDLMFWIPRSPHGSAPVSSPSKPAANRTSTIGDRKSTRLNSSHSSISYA